MGKKGSALQVNKKDAYRGFDLEIQGLAGINTTTAPTAIADNECTAIYNYLPVGKDLWRKVVAASSVCTCSHNISAFANDVLGGTLYMFVVLSDGSAGTISGGVYTQATGAGPGTFNNTGQAIEITNWQNSVLLIVDAINGYFSFTGSTNTVALIDASLYGTTIAVWTGRVFIGNGRVLNYSAPGSYTDFTALSGGGYLTITNTNLKQQISKLIPYQDSLYIVGDHAIIALTGTTISSTPSSWYQMEIFNRLGVLYPQMLVNFNNTLFLGNEFGVWEVASTQSQKVDYALDLSQFSFQAYPACVTQINNLTFYLVPISGYSQVTNTIHSWLLAYCIDLNQFAFLDFGFDITGIYTTLSTTDHSLYVWSGATVYKLFSGTGNVTGYIQSKSFDFGYPFVMKTLQYILLNIYMRSGTPSFTVTGYAQQLSQPFISAVGIQNTFTYQYRLMSYSPSYPTTVIGLTNSYGQLMAFQSTQQVGVGTNIFNISVGGEIVSWSISETSNAVYDILSTFIEGNIGRAIR